MQSKDVMMMRGTLLLQASSKGKKYLSALIKPAGTDGLKIEKSYTCMTNLLHIGKRSKL